MKNTCNCELKEYLTQCVYGLHEEQHLIQDENPAKPPISIESDTEFVPNKEPCCALALITYLADHCKDTNSLINEFRRIIHKTSEQRNDAT